MKPIEKKLLKLFNRLDAPERDMLLGFAEYLVSRASEAAKREQAVPQPLDVPRPDQESVVAAIKRLSSTYHMLDDPRLLNEASVLMSQHVMQGREAEHVIDDLQVLFNKFYEQMLAEFDDSGEDER
ncbi:MAG: Crp/Fnr family transcriptional regulator [Gammaproteobacteria bacterium]|jgi:hypothetical protein